MAVTPHLELKQSQSLVMTPELRQAINLLQLSNLELSTLLEKELESNPLLEREDISNLSEEETPPTIDDYDENKLPEEESYSPDIDYDNQFDDFGSDREGYENQSEYGWQDYIQNKNHQQDEDYDFFEQRLSSPITLEQKIKEQIQLTFPQNKERIIALRLCEYLDAAGYFRGNLGEIAATLKIKEIEIQKILKKMQTFEPDGIFAQDLSECLKIQLQNQNKYDPLIAKVLDNLDLWGEGKITELKKKCGIDDDDFKTIVKDIRSLDPKPAAKYHFENPTYIIPDIFVRRKKDGSYIVELNTMSLPRLLINKRYYSQISKEKNTPTQSYIKQQLSSANFLLRALHQRAETILKVSEEIVKNQYDFFEKGINHLKPMLLKTIAENVEMHESTISRVTTNKYMHTPLGIFELKYFFNGTAGSYIGDETTSTRTIKHKIQKLIESETKDNILSDDKIVSILGQEGIKIARRTVAKYRESLKIPSSSERKRQKNLILE